MTQKTTEKKKARFLQRDVGRDAVSYSTCLRLLRDQGFDEAKRRVEEMARAGDTEVEAMKWRATP